MRFNGKQTCALFALFIATAIAAPAETTFKTLLNFTGTNGSAAPAALIQGLNGNLYGVTSFGGKNNAGTVFEVTTAGKLTTLYSFCSKVNCEDGKYPEAGLLLATNGNFYGTTQNGGVNCVSAGGCGTAFEITPTGKLTTLYSFCSKGGADCTDGDKPKASLIEGLDGNFYGTTFYGGNSNDSGTLFQLTPEGKLTTIYTFCAEAGQNCPDGAYPTGVILGTDENLHFTASGGGGTFSAVAKNSNFCNGMVAEELLAEGEYKKYQEWIEFCEDEIDSLGGPYGALWEFLKINPVGGEDQVPDTDATTPPVLTFYGIASGGAYLSGAIFSITSSKTYKVVYNFCAKANCADGAFPASGLTEGMDGNLYDDRRRECE
jgi:uncharacterized repeat protein (TIGR03803 family)